MLVSTLQFFAIVAFIVIVHLVSLAWDRSTIRERLDRYATFDD